ncbi:MAG: hypothetical protein ACR2RB_19785 [Gammaproteobacteria bacterium]
MTSKRFFQWAAPVALVFLGSACAGFEPLEPEVGSPRGIPEGPGVLSGEEGGVGYAFGKKKKKEADDQHTATAAQPTDSGMSSQAVQEVTELEEYRRFKEWQKAKHDPESTEYKEFQRWKEWRAYQEWQRQSE